MRRKKLSRVILLLAMLAIVVVAGFLGWWFLIRQPPVPHNIIVLSGRIEGDDSTVATKTAGRIREIRVREGDVVRAGDVIALLDEDQAAYVRARAGAEERSMAQVVRRLVAEAARRQREVEAA